MEDKCALRTGQAIKRRDALQAQLTQIKHYRAEYQTHQTSVPVLLANARSFVQRLDSSIQETEQRLETQEQTVEAEVSKLTRAKARRKAVEKLLERQRLITDANNSHSDPVWQNRCRTINDS